MTDAGPEPEQPVRLLRRAGWGVAGALAIIICAVLIDVAVSRYADHRREAGARALVDRIDGNRDQVLDVTASLVGGWSGLGQPRSAWSEVRCSVREKLSDGDGQSSVVGHLQNCSTTVHRVYALPRGIRSPKRAGFLTKTRPSSLADGCEVSLLDGTGTAPAAADGTWNVIDLRWVDTAGQAVDDHESCRLPEADGVRVEQTASRPLTGRYFVVLRMQNQGESGSIGCGGRRFLWFGACEVPDGAPYL